MSSVSLMTDEITEISKDDVVAYLKAHPAFLDENPELLEALTPPSYHKHGGAVDMQRFMVDRLRKEIETLQSEFGELIHSARDNLSAQAQVHEAVVHLLRCSTLQEVSLLLESELQVLFGVDAVSVCLESDVVPKDGALPDEQGLTGVQFLRPGMVQAILGSKSSVVLAAEGNAISMVFGEAAPLVASYALVRLRLLHPDRPGILAFGVRDLNHFHPGQGTELLQFLGHITEICLEKCLMKNS